MTVPGVSWHSFDLRTGRRGQRMATQTKGAYSRTIGAVTDTQLSVLSYDAEQETSVDGRPTSAGAVPGWEAATLPGRTMLVALEDDTERPLWAGMVNRRRSGKGQWVSLDLVSLEGYFDRRYVSDLDYYQTPQGVIVQGILTSCVVPTGVQFTVDADSPALVDRTYLNDEDKTVLSVLQELMGTEGGPEFTVDLEWADESHTVLRMVVRVRTRLGTAARPGAGAGLGAATFSLPGCVTDFEHVEDFTAENGANDVLATSSGEGTSRPMSDHQIATDLLAGGWAKFERRFEPTTSLTDIETLNGHAKADLADRRDGLTQLSLTCRYDVAPQPGVHFNLGDDVSVSLTCERFPAMKGPDGDLVAGYVKTVRCIGYAVDLDENTMVPTLWEVG